MPQTATIKSLTRAFRMMKAMQAQGVEWGEDYRRAAGEALKGILAGRMAAAIDRHLDEMAARGQADRRNGSYARHLLTELGDIELHVPRTRCYSPLSVLRAYARRTGHIDRMILACFVLGLSTRKVASALLPVLGRRISAGTVSQVAKTLDAAVAAFHRRPLTDQYPVLMLDGVVLARKTGAGALRRPVLVALGLRPGRLAPGHRGERRPMGAVPQRSPSPRPHRPAPRDDRRRWRQRPAGRPADRLSGHPRPALLGPQDPQCPRQGPRRRSARRQERPACHHECRDPAPGPRRRPPLRRPLASDLPQSRRLPAERPRRAAHLLALQDPRPAQARANHQRHRAPLPRGATPHQTHGRLPGPHLHGPHPLRPLHPRKLTPGSPYPLLPDTNLLTLPRAMLRCEKPGS